MTLREQRRLKIENKIAKLKAMEEGAILMIVRVREALPELERQLRRHDKRTERIAKAIATPLPQEGLKKIIRGEVETGPPKVPDDLGIPEFLKRPPLTGAAAEVAKEVAEQKAAKTKARVGKMKAIKTERDAMNAIPRSKRRWDVNTSKWIAG